MAYYKFNCAKIAILFQLFGEPNISRDVHVFEQVL